MPPRSQEPGTVKHAANSSGADDAVARVVAHVILRRARGETCPDAQVIAEHAHLMPGLAERLRMLARVTAAVRTVRADAHAAAGPSAGAAPPGLAPPGYELLGDVHRGGQGVVCRAVQKSTGRTVAIKLLREGPLAGAAELARFGREVQVLAQLSHPNIVAIHDSGVADGRHYFVMDYVDGQPLDAYVAGLRSTSSQWVVQTLQVLAKVCDAVATAHLLGIVHRDLKPGNILIAPGGEPRVLDFGLAKIVGGVADASSAAAAVMTHTGEFVGSLPWASPEQVAGQPGRLGAATDVYSLGVIAYQAFTGRFPYPLGGTIRDIVDNIVSVEPVAPRRLSSAIDDDLSAILLRALEKQPERRYATVADLAADLRRYLAHEPVAARPPNALYRLRKFARRHRGVVWSAAAVAAALVLGVVGLAVGLLRESRQRAIAQQNERRAQTQADIAVSTSKFLNDVLAAANRGRQGGRADVTVREMLDQAAQEVEAGSLAARPEVEASVRRTIGLTYMALGLTPAAEAHHRRALELRERLHGGDHVEVVESLWDLAHVYWESDRLAEAEPLVRRAVEMEQRVRPDDGDARCTALNNLGSLLLYQRKYDEAEAQFKAALDLLRSDPSLSRDELATVLNNLAELNRSRGDYAAALGFARECLDLRTSLYGEQDERTASSLDGLAAILARLGDYEAALAAGRRALDVQRKIWGERHQTVAITLGRMAWAAHRGGRPAQAESLYREALEMTESLMGPKHFRTQEALNGLAETIADAGRPAEAEPLLRRVVELAREGGPQGNPRLGDYLLNLSSVLAEQSRLEDAAHAARDALAARRERLPAGAWQIADAQSVLGAALARLGQDEEAEALLLGAWQELQSSPGALPRRKRLALECLAAFYEARRQPERAAAWRARLDNTQP